MPSLQSTTSKIKLHEVTWYSRLGAIILFIGVVPALTFYIGMQYEMTLQDTSKTSSSPMQTILVMQKSAAATSTLSVIKENQWYKNDGNNVYEKGDSGEWQILVFADPASFSVLENGYAEDRKHVFYKNILAPSNGPTNILQKADPKTFIVLSTSFSKDANHVWAIDPGFGGVHVLEGADPVTFKVISDVPNGPADNIYGQDAHHEFGSVGDKNFTIGLRKTF